MERDIKVSGSILAANLGILHQELQSVEQGGADWHHIDVMDGHFVPNLSFGLPLIRSVKSVSSLPLDVHIMVANPDQVAASYVEAGADLLTFHIEASHHPHRLVQSIQAMGAKAGVALNPGSPLQMLEPLLPYVDLVLLMSVNPGFGGQSFISASVERMKALANMVQKAGRMGKLELQVDGGINADTCRSMVDSGASCLVAGSYIYQASNRAEAIASLKSKPVS